MAEAPSESALIKFGPMAAWIGGGLLMVVFVLLAVVLGDTETPKRKIDDAVSQVNSKLNDQKTSVPAPEFGAQGLNGADQAFGVVKGGKIPSKIADEHKLLDMPTQFRVVLEEPPPTGGAFDDCDADKNEELNRDEYARSDKYLKESVKFRTADANRNNGVSRAEYNGKPDENKRLFEWLDVEGARDNTDDGDDRLSESEYSKSGKADFKEKDKNSDGYLTFEEFGKVVEPAKIFDLGAPRDVAAAANSKDFVITVTWAAPDIKDAPTDLGYWILRKSPKDLDDRKRRYQTEDLPKWQKKADEWDKKRAAWKGSAEDFEKASGPRPVRPPQPSDWELLNDTPVTELKYEDRSFRSEYTYKYAVRATTKENLKPGTKSDDKFADGYHTSDPTEMAGRPVVIYNRIEMSWQAKTETTAKIKLRKYSAIGGTWRAVEVIVEVGQGEDVGGLWDVAAIKGKGFPVAVVDAEGKANAEMLKALESSRDKIEFSTGWTFNRFVGSDIELGQKGGSLRFVLPKDTKDPAKEAPMDPSGMANPIAIRLISADKGGDKARLEITRWKQFEGHWYRIVAYQDVKKVDAVGYSKEQIAGLKIGESIFFFDEGGIEIKSDAEANRRTLRDITMETGLTWAGIDKRTLDFGSGKMDIWGVFYVDK